MYNWNEKCTRANTQLYWRTSSPQALEAIHATFTGSSQIRAGSRRAPSSSSSGSLRPEAAAARSCMNLSTSSTLVGMGAWVVKGSEIGNFGQALERHHSHCPAFKRRGLSPQAQRAAPAKRVGLRSSRWPHRLLRARAPLSMLRAGDSSPASPPSVASPPTPAM